MNRVKEFYKSNSKLVNALLQSIILVVIAWLLITRLSDGISKAGEVITTFHWQLIAATGAFTIAVISTGLIWGQLINSLGLKRKVNSKEAIHVHVVSWLLKYIPGQAGSFLSKVAWAKREGLEQKVAVSSIMYENIFLASSSVLLSIPLGLGVIQRIGNEQTLIIPFVLTLSILTLLIPSVFNKALTVGLKLIKKDSTKRTHSLESKDIFRNQLLFLIPRFINGIGFVLLCTIFFQPNPFEMLQLTGAYALAGIIGILAFFVPSGLGVREAVIVITAGPIIGATRATAVAILARVCATLADVILGFIYSVFRFDHARKTKDIN